MLLRNDLFYVSLTASSNNGSQSPTNIARTRPIWRC